jgi:hypothetical protein
VPRTLIARTPISQRIVAAVEGERLIHRYQLLTSLLAQELPPGREGLLCEPEEDRQANEIVWYTDLPGPVVPAEQLPTGEHRYMEELLIERISELQRLAQELKDAPASSRNLAGAFLEKLLTAAADWRLYSAGGRPVVAEWGLEPVRGGPRQLSALTEEEGYGKAPSAACPPPAVPRPNPPPPVPLGSPPAAYPAWRPPPPAGRGWLRFGLGLFVPLLLLLLLLLIFFPGFYGLGPWGGPATPAAWHDDDSGLEDDLTLELARLREAYLAELAACRPGSPGSVTPGGGSAAYADGDSGGNPPDGSLPDAMPGEFPDPDAEYPDEGAEADGEEFEDGAWEGLEEGQEEGQDEGQEEGDDPEEQPQEQPQEQSQEQPQDQVQIPDTARDSGDVSFLDGCWNSRSNLYNLRTRTPLNYQYCFEDGKGRVAIQAQDDQGNTVDNCSGTATARMENGKLVIQEDGRPVCEEGGTYHASTITCTPKDGQESAECGIQQEGREVDPDSGFTRSK